MSQRFYVAAVELVDMPQGGQGYRPALPVGVSFSAIIPSNPDGTPRLPWVVCLVDADDHSELEKSASVMSLGLTPESPMADVRQNLRSQYTNKLRQSGYAELSIDWAVDKAQDVFDKMATIAEPAYKRGTVSARSR